MISDDDWFAAVEQSLTNPNLRIGDIALPGFPEKDIVDLTISNGTSINMLRSAFALYSTLKKYAAKYGQPLSQDSTVLDFGCGWGRIARFFLREIPLENLYGVDVVPTLVRACKATFRSPNFRAIRQKGRLPHKTASFDIVFANSVFSHLNEKLNLKWVREIRRVLKPGGLAMLTIITEDKFELMSVGSKDWIDSLEFDKETLKAELNDGKLSWISTGRKQRKLTGYGIAVIPHTWIEANWSDSFSVLEMDEEQSQAIVVLQKSDSEEKASGLLSKLLSRGS